MRILWFTNTYNAYVGTINNPYNGGGWMQSMQEQLVKLDGVELAISFFMNGQPRRVEKNGITFYPMPRPRFGIWRKLHDRLFDPYQRGRWPDYEHTLLDVVEDFCPDIIHIFGSENVYGLLASRCQVPVVLHIQGIINPYRDALLPPFVSWNDLRLLPINRRGWNIQSCCEREIYHRVQHFIGRTEWSRRVTAVLNPKARYHYGGEILRSVFYKDATRQLPERMTIVTTISGTTYKGFDMVLKTAKLLHETMGLDFEWQCYGITDTRFFERHFGVRHEEVGIHLMGVATAEELHEALIHATAYMHPSYIENSPNSLCEAQLVGLPVVATNVGGVASLIEEGRTGYLVPANDPWQAAYLLAMLHSDRQLNISVGSAARVMALERHNPNKIAEELMNTYREVIDNDAQTKAGKNI